MSKESTETETVKMRLIGSDFAGFKDGARHTYKKGDIVPLTRYQAECFKDQFEDPRIVEEVAKQAARDKIQAEKDAKELAEKEAAEQQKLEEEQRAAMEAEKKQQGKGSGNK